MLKHSVIESTHTSQAHTYTHTHTASRNEVRGETKETAARFARLIRNNDNDNDVDVGEGEDGGGDLPSASCHCQLPVSRDCLSSELSIQSTRTKPEQSPTRAAE